MGTGSIGFLKNITIALAFFFQLKSHPKILVSFAFDIMAVFSTPLFPCCFYE